MISEAPAATTFDFAALHERQTRHPVVRSIPLGTLEHLGRDAALEKTNRREELIARMAENRLFHGYRPPHWRRIDLWLARKRLEVPHAVISLFVLGGQDSGKTDGAVAAVTAHFFHTEKAWTWMLHSTEDSSQTIHQARMWDYLPPDIKARLKASGGMSKTLTQKLKYNPDTGFTGNKFFLKRSVVLPWRPGGRAVPCGGLCGFHFFSSDPRRKQGAKITSANSDELVDDTMATTVSERLLNDRTRITSDRWFLDQMREIVRILEDVDEKGFPKQQLSAAHLGLLYTKVHVMGFTPIEGWSPLVAQALDGAETLLEEEAELLPIFNAAREVIGHEKVPLFKQPRKRTDLVAYLPTHANPWADVEGKRESLRDETEEVIRVKYYGDVRKNWDSLYSFEPKMKRNGALVPWHVRTWETAPRDGTIYEVVDGAKAKPITVAWILCDVFERHWVLQEWPCPRIARDGVLPGPWAVTSKHGKLNGDPGPASRKTKRRWSAADNLHMIWMMRRRLVERFKATGDPFRGDVHTLTLEWKDRPEMKLEGEFIIPERSLMDSRFADAPTSNKKGEESTILEDYWMEENAIPFDPSSGVQLKEGDNKIQLQLAKIAQGMPGLMVIDECENTIFMFQTYSNAPGSNSPPKDDEACKDQRDPVAYAELCGMRYIDREKMRGKAGGSFGNRR